MSVIYVYAPEVLGLPPIPDPEPPKPVGLPYSIRSNCYAYVRHTYPQLPGTDTILANLSDSGEVAVFYYPDSGLHHYAVVVSMEPFVVRDSNYGSDTIQTRNETSKYLIGFYDL